MATKEIRKVSRVELKTTEEVVVQWGVRDTRTNKIVRAASTREIARNFAKRSKFLEVVRREVVTYGWESEKTNLFFSV